MSQPFKALGLDPRSLSPELMRRASAATRAGAAHASSPAPGRATDLAAKVRDKLGLAANASLDEILNAVSAAKARKKSAPVSPAALAEGAAALANAEYRAMFGDDGTTPATAADFAVERAVDAMTDEAVYASLFGAEK